MKYMGSKSRIAKDIVPIIQSYITEKTVAYIEPFVGGANVIDKIRCKEKIGSDVNKYLIALLKHVQSEYELYESVNKELYSAARTAFNSGNTSEFENWQIGNIGFLASYNGRFFDGGYAKTGIEKTKNGERVRNYYEESKNNLLKQSKDKLFKDIQFYCNRYTDLDDGIKNCVIYCDPPYAGMKQYSSSADFDHIEFWGIMREMSKNNIVIVSEENSTPDFECIWEQEVSRSIKAKDKSVSTEKLFMFKGGMK